MKVLIDTPWRGWSHLVADSIPNLHAFAEKAGLKRAYFENKRGRNQPHYDVREKDFKRVIEAGARLVTRKELHAFLSLNYPAKINQ